VGVTRVTYEVRRSGMVVNLQLSINIGDLGDFEHVAPLLRELLSPQRRETPPPIDRTTWGLSEMEELWEEVSPATKKVLRAIAGKPQGISEDELIENLEGQITDGDLDMSAVNAYLSPVALKPDEGGVVREVYRKDPQTGLLTMPPHVASAIVLLGSEDDRTDRSGGKVSKSEEMRRMARRGFTTSEIAKQMGVRYQFVHNVLSQAGLLKQEMDR
jgi:hypothetical protein